MKVLIVDDHAVVRHGVRHILEEWQSGMCIGQAQNADEALKFLGEKKWDILILDITLPGKSGIVLLGEIRTMYPDLPVLVLSMHPEDQYALRMIKAGASGYMTKETAPEELITAIKKIMGGGKYVSASLADRIVSDKVEDLSDLLPHETLSDREHEVLRMIAIGKTQTEIGEILTVSAKTVSTYKRRIMAKMCMTSEADLVRYAVRHGLVH